MIVAGCDVGSLTAEAVILRDKKILAGEIIRVRATAAVSARQVMDRALEKAGISMEDLNACYSTGYGRLHIPFASKNISEISCHGMGAFFLNNQIRTIIDVGGQDCKVLRIDSQGLVQEFVMNDKCAAGTGRSLEILSKALDVTLEELGSLAARSRRPANIGNKCGIFMEQEVLWHWYKNKRTADIAAGINHAVARRVASLARSVTVEAQLAVTGGVSKNLSMVGFLEELMEMGSVSLPADPQLVGAIGAAVFAGLELEGSESGVL